MIQTDYPSGLTLNYSYDEKGQLDQIAQKSWLKDKVLVSNLSDKNSYDNQLAFNFGNGVSQSQAYRDNEVVEWTGNKDIAYSYSTPYQGGYAIDYAYPSVSNDTSVSTDSTSQNSQSTQSSNNAVPNERSKVVAQTTTTADQYNPMGQLLQESGRQYSYDSLGRLTQVTDNKSSTVTYDYLITGERYKKSVLDSSQANQAQQTTYYLYDNGILISELTQTATEDKSQFTDYVYHDNRPLLQFNKLEPFYLKTDHRGSVMTVTDEDANIVWQAYLTDNGQATVFNGSQIAINLRGSNQYYDAETSLHYNIHRYFSPTRNQYLTPDPVGLVAGEDLYAFANDRPHEFVDLWGLAPEMYEDMYKKRPFLEKAIIGMVVHRDLANVLNSRLLLGYGADKGRDGTFGNIRPDAYFVDEVNIRLELAKKPFTGTVWELKPISWLQDTKVRYKRGVAQVKTYLDKAKTTCKSAWRAGSYKELAPQIKQIERTLSLGNKSFKITTHADTFNGKGPIYSGLVFYKATEVKSEKVPETLPETAAEPVLTEQQKSQLQTAVDYVKEAATSDGLSGILIKGLLIILALAAAYFLARALPALLANLILLLTASAALAKEGVVDENGNKQKVSLLDALSTSLGIKITKETIKDYASKKWDQTTDWVKGWFN